ncbi:MAG: S-layer homology domain-containing protein [Clostridiales bacterium]
MNKRLLSMFLALCMIVTMLPVSAMAEEIHTTIGGSGEIISFAPLAETEKAVSLGTSIEDLELPETLTATVRTAVSIGEDAVQDSGSPKTATPTTATEPEWEETTGDIPVTWDSPDYDPNTEDVYVFTPVIEGYTVSAKLPELTVTVGAAIMGRGMVAPLSVTTYNIWVGGVQVTSENKGDVFGIADGDDATVTYDPANNTLTLDNATINAAHDGTWIDSSTTAYYGIYADTALKIEMVGSNTVIGKNQTGIASIGIYTGGTLNLSGSGSLYVSGGTGNFSIGIYSAGNIAIEGGRVTAASVAATQTSIAIASNGDIMISNEGVESSANTSAPNSYGMIATNSFTINDGEVTASGKTGLHTNAAEGPVTISGGKLTANGSQVGIAGAVTVTGGTMTVKSDTKALNGSLTTSGYEGCTVTAGANKNGDGAATYNAANLATYKYIKVEPATVTNYDVWVGGVQVTSTNKGGITGTGITGTITYDSDSSTLTLNGAEIGAESQYQWSSTTVVDAKAHAAVYAKEKLNVVLTGNNSLTGGSQDGDRDESYGLYCGGALTITGSGTLEALGATMDKSSCDSFGLYVNGALSIGDGTTMTARGGDVTGGNGVSFGVFGKGTGGLTVKNATLTVASGIGYNSYGVRIMQGDINITNSNVTATSRNANMYNRALEANNGDILISGGTVSASAEKGNSSAYCIAISIPNGKNIAISSGAAVTAQAGNTVSGGRAMSHAPNLDGYGSAYYGKASANYDGSSPVTYAPANIESYKYLMFMANASGAAITTPATDATKSHNQITVNAAVASSNPGGQTIEYAISTSNSTAPGSGWQAATSFSGLLPSTTYYVWARTATKAGYEAGAAVASAAITTTVASVNASISPTSVTFDLNPKVNGRDGFDITLTSETYTLTAVKNGETPLSKIQDYSVDENLYHFKYQYLKNLPIGLTTITFDMSGGTSPTLALTIEDTRTELTSVAIDNTAPTFGDTLSATINPSGAAVSYVWRADSLIVGTGATYEVKAADIGKIITLIVTGNENNGYKGTVTSSATSAVAAKDYSVTVDSAKSVIRGSGLSALPTANAGAVNGTLTWYSDSGRTKAVTDSGLRSLVTGSVVTVYWSFTATTVGYVTTPKTGECVVTIVSGAEQTLSFAESTVTKTVGDPIFTNVLTHSVGTGAVSYSSSNTSVAAVNPTTGAVVIVGAGTTTITANAAMVLGEYAPGIASFTLTVNNVPIQTVSVGSQSGTVVAGTAGSLTYTVTTANIPNGTYAVSVANLPAGVTVGNSGNVTISGNSGTLTLTVADTVAAGTTDTLALTLDGTTSAAFGIVIGAPMPSLSATDITLDAVTVGYMSSNYKSVVITNSGDAQATINNVTTDRPSVFSIHSGQSFVAANSSINSWQIRAATGLAVGIHTATLTVTYDGGRTATATVSITVNAVGNYTVTFNPNGGMVSETSRSVTSGTAVGTLPTPTRSGSYSFDGWYTAASGGTQISASTTVSANVIYYAHWTYSGGGGSGSGGGSSSNDNSSPVIVTPPAPDKPNSPTQGEIKVSGTVDSKGNVIVNITGKTVTDAFDKALAEAKKNGTEQNGITVVLHVDTGSKTGSNVTVNLPKAVQDTIIEKKIVNTIVVVDNPDIRIGMDLTTVQEINKQAKSDVNITATRGDSGKLTGDAKKAIGSRPVFDLKVNYGNGKTVSSFGAGSVSVTIPYTLGANEKAGNVQAVYVDSKGKVHWLINSVYDSVKKVLRFSTNHFSTYGIGYMQTNTAFKDIAGHWAKEDIEFVVSRGLFSGTSETKFSPNAAMTRGMFVTVLGRLASADVSGYAKSSFSDVKSDAYYMGYIEWASKNNIVNGIGNGKFAPDQSITREQMAVIMSNYAKTTGYTLPKVHVENIFADNGKISAYAKEAVKQMQMAGVISGKNGNLFDPQGTATRAEVSAVLRRFVELAISSDTAQGWTMNDSGKWMYFKDGKPLTGKQDIDGGAYTFDQYGVTADVPKNLRYTTYIVQKGDSFWLIAHKLGCTMSELERLNNKSRFSIIYPGDVLRVPEK